jgi:hypothetical protein
MGKHAKTMHAPVLAGRLKVGRHAAVVYQVQVLPQMVIAGQVAKLMTDERTINCESLLAYVLQYVQKNLSGQHIKEAGAVLRGCARSVRLALLYMDLLFLS